MSWALAGAGWSVALALALTLRARLALVADAEHELRGAAAAIGLAAERMRRAGATRAFAALVALQIDRMEAALRDIGRARDAWGRRAGARRATPAATRCAARIDAGRLSQIVANLVDNAAEHGTGPVDVRWTATTAGARLEIRNRNGPSEPDDLGPGSRPGRGRGLAIAKRAARDLGGDLSVESGGDATLATLELPAVGRGRSRAA